MTKPNSLIFVDFASDDPAKAAEFYAKVLGWTNDPRPFGLWHRLVPGGTFANKDGTSSEISHLNFGVFRADNVRPHPSAASDAPRNLAPAGRRARIWIEVSDDDSAERILSTAEALGAQILWRKHYWREFNGYNHSFRDPWGNEIVLWKDAGESPVIPADYTQDGVT
jgi:predicted enzyme related to lactoylglutathione lyase